MENCDGGYLCPDCKSCIPTGKKNPKRRFFCHKINRTISGTTECADFTEATTQFKERNKKILSKNNS